MVQVSGVWYYLDATFDDPVFYSSSGKLLQKSAVEHTYFNFKTDSSHILGTFDTSDPFNEASENYEVLPKAG